MPGLPGEHAVVIGGGVAGLLAARVLADHHERVTVIERDEIGGEPALRDSVPQGRHYHALLLGGQRVLSELFPGFLGRLHEHGAARIRVGEEAAWVFPDGIAYSPTGGARRPHDLGFEAHSQSRELIEHCIRRSTLELANVRLETGTTVRGLVYGSGRIRGVDCESREGPGVLEADLVVDAGGSGSRAVRWLADLGLPVPAETTLGVDIGYASTKYRIPESYDAPERVLIYTSASTSLPHRAIMGEIEGRAWHLSLVGRFGSHPPGDEAGFLAFARSVHSPGLHRLIRDAERVDDIARFKFPVSVWRHYEALNGIPDGFLAIGDAVGRFNPVYGQGISSAALQAAVLRRRLAELAAGPSGLDGLAPGFFRDVAGVIATPWALAADQDLAFPETRGERPPDVRERARYLAALARLEAEDPEVFRLTTEVFHLAKPLSALWEEPLRSRVLKLVGK